MDTWFKRNLERITAELALHTPVKPVTFRSKPWWSGHLSQLRRAYNSTLRSSKADRFDAALLASARAARTAYFKAIKNTKRDHWSAFLATATLQTVWMAKRYPVGRPPHRFPERPGATTPLELNKALLDHFFFRERARPFDSILLPFRHCPALAADEIGRALARSSPLSAPGPDITANSVWKRVHRVAPHLIQDLLAPLVAHGFHPPPLKMADGIVLDNPGKPSYDSPSSFPVIMLLQTFSKILERIRNSRLLCVARVAGLLDPHEYGSLAGLSASDATTTLSHEVRTLQMAGRKVSTLFLDIKGRFDNVNPSTLGSMLKAKAVNPYLVSSTRSLLTGRTCRLPTRDRGTFLPQSPWAPRKAPQSPRCCLLFMFPDSTSRSLSASPSPMLTTLVRGFLQRPIDVTCNPYRGDTRC